MEGTRSLTLSKVFLLFKPEIKTSKRGNTEFRIQMTNNPVPHVDPCISDVFIPTYISPYTTPITPHPMTTRVWNGTVGPNFGHSGVQESLLTQVPQKARLITILPLGEQMWKRCMSHDTVHTSVSHQRHTRELTHKGRSEVYLSFVSVIGGLPIKPVCRKSVVGV